MKSASPQRIRPRSDQLAEQLVPASTSFRTRVPPMSFEDTQSFLQTSRGSVGSR